MKRWYKFFHIYTISHIHRYIGSQEEGVSSGSLLLYKKAPVSWTGHPLLLRDTGVPRDRSSPTDISTGVPQLGVRWLSPKAGEESRKGSLERGTELSPEEIYHIVLKEE